MEERTDPVRASQDQPETQGDVNNVAPPDNSAAPPAPDSAPPPGGPDPAALLKQFSTQARTAATAALKMGQLAIDYISARMTLSDACQRDACVKCLVSAWQEHADDVISPTRVNQLVRTAAAWNILNAPTALKPGKVALRVVREFSPLLERDGAERAETWRILPALEERGRVLWGEVTSKYLTGEEAAHAVAKLIADHKAELAAQAAQTAADPNATPADKEAAAKAAEDASKASAGADKKQKRTRKGKAESGPASVGPAQRDGTQAPKSEAPSRGENLLATLARSAKSGTGKDFAELLAAAALQVDDPLALLHDMASALTTLSDTPDDALRALIAGAKQSKNLSKVGNRAADAALVVLSATEKGSKTSAA